MSTEQKKRVTRPSKETFESELKDLEKALKAAEAELETARDAVKRAVGGSSSPQNPEREKLLARMNELKAEQAETRKSRGAILDEVKVIDTAIQRKKKEIEALQSRTKFRSLDDLNARIKSLEQEVDSGTLRLVDEKRYLSDISNLKKSRTNFGGITKLQEELDADKAKLTAIKANLPANSSKAAMDKQFEEIKAKLNEIYESQQKSYQSRTSLFAKRDAAQKAREAAWASIVKHKDAYYTQAREFRAQADAERTERIEREKSERVEREKAKKREEAESKLEAASEPAFAAQIDIAENLLVHFDPEYKRAVTSLHADDGTLSAKGQQREIEGIPEGATIVKKSDDDFLVAGTSGKKNKKRGGNDSKLKLNVGIIDDLAALNISVPVSKDDVPSTIEKIKEKVKFYKENEVRVTTERIERAKAEIAKLEAQAEKEAANGEADKKAETETKPETETETKTETETAPETNGEVEATA